jgi:hypothetical protein
VRKSSEFGLWAKAETMNTIRRTKRLNMPRFYHLVQDVSNTLRAKPRNGWLVEDIYLHRALDTRP